MKNTPLKIIVALLLFTLSNTCLPLFSQAQTNRERYISLLREGTYLQEDTLNYPRFIYYQYKDGVGRHTLHNPANYFNLDSVGGEGTDFEQILNILLWLKNEIPHDGMNYPVCEMDAIDIWNYSKATGRGVNCTALAIALNECYLSIGIPSRYVWCMPADIDDGDCHVINSVWSDTFGKWIWIDPSLGCYVVSGEGLPLGIDQVRSLLIDGETFHAKYADGAPFEGGEFEDYLTYMSKNLYWFICRSEQAYNTESNYHFQYSAMVALVPSDMETSFIEADRGVVVTRDSGYFWQEPCDLEIGW